MKPIFLFLLLPFLGLTNVHSQDTSSLTKKYPLTVLMKVNDVASVINLSADRQIRLANLFQKKMAQIQAVMQNDSTGRLVKAVKTSISAEFSTILTPVELALYTQQRKGSDYALKPVVKGGFMQKPMAHN